MQCGLNLFAGLTGVHFIQNVQKWGQLAFTIERIHIVVDSNVTDAFAGEIDFRVLPSENIIAAQAGKVFGDHAVDFSIFDIIDHPLEGGAVIVRSGPSVIHIFAYYVQAMGLGVVSKHDALGLDAAALGL